MASAKQQQCLGYAGVDAAWETRELSAFTAASRGGIRPATAMAQYLLGRLLAEDLHVSCRPMLPLDVAKMNRVCIEGVCLLQIVDIVNIGASVEHRKEVSTGPTRTLKLGLTDGHQLVHGFEFQWLPQLSLQTPRGAKVVVQNVAVRHGMLLLTPETCQLVGASGNADLDVGRAWTIKPKSGGAAAVGDQSSNSTGLYSAALMTAGGSEVAAARARKATSASVSVTAPQLPGSHSDTASGVTMLTPVATPAVQRSGGQWSHPDGQSRDLRSARPTHSDPGRVDAPPITTNTTATSSSVPRRFASPPETRRLRSEPPVQTLPEFVSPSVFIDISSEDDGADSDMTDPAVEHLFYSPNTPRIPPSARDVALSRKRAHPESARAVPHRPHATPHATEHPRMTDSGGPSMQHRQLFVASNESSSSSIVSSRSDHRNTTAAPQFALFPPLASATTEDRLDVTAPFRYFKSPRKEMNVPVTASSMPPNGMLVVRAFVKSVTGFQFNTGSYVLHVKIEDGTDIRDAVVAPTFAETLMGVPCREFMVAMQQTPPVAHAWAAKMQVRLMKMQGIMRLQRDANSAMFTLLDCRVYRPQDAHALLRRVTHYRAVDLR